VRNKPEHAEKTWRVAILPFVEGLGLYNEYREQEPWDSPHNSQLASQRPACFHCPSYVHHVAEHGQPSSADAVLTNYVALVSSTSDLDRSSRRGVSAAFWVMEIGKPPIHWMQPLDVDLETATHRYSAPEPFHHESGMHVLRPDGSVQFVQKQAPPDFKELLSAAADQHSASPLPR
jgi:hypothetical protein